MYTDAAPCVRMYSRKNVVAYYSRYAELEKPEETILRALSPRLARVRMLDIGVGGGRMTEYFAPRVKDYYGIDICPGMVAACRQRFRGTIPEDRFMLRDMRELHLYPAHAFDLVLNTYNTLDHLGHLERMRFIEQARRIVAPGGYLCFSSHNIRSLANYLEPFKWSSVRWRHPRAALRSLRHRARFLKLNRAALERHAEAEYVVIHNGTHGDFDVQLYYVRPLVQLEALKAAGFGEITVYSLDTGEEMTEAQAGASTDRWLYYLCR